MRRKKVYRRLTLEVVESRVCLDGAALLEATLTGVGDVIERELDHPLAVPPESVSPVSRPRGNDVVERSFSVNVEPSERILNEMRLVVDPPTPNLSDVPSDPAGAEWPSGDAPASDHVEITGETSTPASQATGRAVDIKKNTDIKIP